MLSTHSCWVRSLAALGCSNSALRAWGSISSSLSGAAVILENDARQRLYLYICMCLGLSKHYRRNHLSTRSSYTYGDLQIDLRWCLSRNSIIALSTATRTDSTRIAGVTIPSHAPGLCFQKQTEGAVLKVGIVHGTACTGAVWVEDKALKLCWTTARWLIPKAERAKHASLMQLLLVAFFLISSLSEQRPCGVGSALISPRCWD